MFAAVPAAWLLIFGLAADTAPDARAADRSRDCGAAFAAASVPGVSSDSLVSAVRIATADAGGTARVRVEGAYGAVRVAGRPGLGQVRATATVCTNVARFLPSLQLAAERRGADVVVTPRRPSGSAVAMAPVGFWMVLTVEVPAELPVEVETVGDLDARGVAGLRADARSGQVHVADVAGDVWLRHRAGDVAIEDVGGRVALDGDGVGDLTVARVRRDVRVRHQRAGVVRVDRVGGDFVIERAGHIDVHTNLVAGRVVVPEATR